MIMWTCYNNFSSSTEAIKKPSKVRLIHLQEQCVISKLRFRYIYQQLPEKNCFLENVKLYLFSFYSLDLGYIFVSYTLKHVTL